MANHSLVRSSDRGSQDKNLVGSLDRFGKTAGSRDSVDSILTHVCTPITVGGVSVLKFPLPLGSMLTKISIFLKNL